MNEFERQAAISLEQLSKFYSMRNEEIQEMQKRKYSAQNVFTTDDTQRGNDQDFISISEEAQLRNAQSQLNIQQKPVSVLEGSYPTEIMKSLDKHAIGQQSNQSI